MALAIETKQGVSERRRSYGEFLLNDLGLRPYTDNEIRFLYENAVEAITIGLNRQGKKEYEDGGVLAIDSLIGPSERLTLDDVPIGAEAVFCAFGGTHWKAAVAKYLGDEEFDFDYGKGRDFPANERKFESVEDFANTMLDVICKDREVGQLPSTLAISFGFENDAIRDGVEVDAKLISDAPAKLWEIVGAEGVILGKLLKKLAKDKGWNIENVFITNDTVAVALENEEGFVAGTGTNGCSAKNKNKKEKLHNKEVFVSEVVEGDDENSLKNLELGKLSFKKDDWLVVARSLNMLTEDESMSEFTTGGGYMMAALASVVKMLESDFEACMVNAISEHDSKVLSLFAQQRFDEVLSLLGVHDDLTEDQLEFLRETSENVLYKCGQGIGILQAAMYAAAGTDLNTPMKVEGGVFWKGWNVRQVVDETVTQLLGRPLNYNQVNGHEQLVKFALSQVYSNRQKVT